MPVEAADVGGITSEEEEEQFERLNDWMDTRGLPRGVLAYDFAGGWPLRRHMGPRLKDAAGTPAFIR